MMVVEEIERLRELKRVLRDERRLLRATAASICVPSDPASSTSSQNALPSGPPNKRAAARLVHLSSETPI